MKKCFFCLTIVFLLQTFSNNILAQKKFLKSALKTKIKKMSDDPNQSIMDIGNFSMWIGANGFHNCSVNGTWNGEFPKGSGLGVIYEEGIVWGAIVHDGGSQVVRVGGNNYHSGTTANNRIYRVRSDYKTADLTSDAASFFMVPVNQVTAAQIQQLRNQYDTDWKEWPADKGAPFNDINNDGIYEADIDTPGVPGAGQTIWTSYNDSNSENCFGSIPIGLNVNETLWSYKNNGPLGNTIFKKLDLIYRYRFICCRF